MSLFQIVWVHLKCERCGKVHETDVQFHSQITEQKDYQLGERVPDGEHLYVGEVYEGVTVRYCGDCHHKWAAAKSSACYDSLIELIDQGRVTARDAEKGTPLSKEEILEYGTRYTEEEVINVPYINDNAIFFDELEVLWGSEPVVAGETHWEEFLNAMGPLVERRMLDAGWRTDEHIWEDFRVYLDADRRIVAEDMEGKRL